ncbi:hypothetical protein HRbin12_01299 [bacterium HR12]|nr:hypothetical protein HRbin12_01299 [bacterium HR12]
MLMVPMTARVVAAFRACGRRKACTPSAIASTPVSAVAPDENARSTRKTVSACSGSRWSDADGAVGQPPRQRTKPVMSVRYTIATNP